MKVYRLTECSGVWEDYMEYGLGIYVSKQAALDAKKQYEKLNEEAEKQFLLCQECMEENGDDGWEECKQMCLSFKQDKHDKNSCANWMSSWDYKTYRITEEQLIE